MTSAFGLTQRVFFGLATLFLTAAVLCGQEPPSSQAAAEPHTSVLEDWSTRRMIYTRNGSADDMSKLLDNPRFMHSTLLRYLREHNSQAGQLATTASHPAGLNEPGVVEDDGSGLLGLRQRNLWVRKNKHSKVDWSVSLGPNGGMSAGETPGIFTYNYSVPSCSNLTAAPPTVGDFAVYTINATPNVASQANLVGITNLYTTGDGSGFCPGTGPAFLFSYAIGSGGSSLSPVLSLDGTKVAWIENKGSGDAFLHVTVWVANQGADATSPIAPNGTFLNGRCTVSGQSCDFSLDYTNATYSGCAKHRGTNGHSELYVDYASNTGYISANNGQLYHINNIFSSTASPSIDFCVQVNATFATTPSSAMSGPLYNELTNQIFITDSEKVYAYKVTSLPTPSFVPAATPYTYGNAASGYNYQTGPGPILDVINNYLYLFSTYDAAGKTSVTQVPTSLTSGVAVNLGNKSTNANQILFDGAFDNNYYVNGPMNAASTLYTCGTDSTTTTQGLYAITFNSSTGVVNPAASMSDNKNVNPGGAANGVCSPITEFFDGSKDRIFVGMGQPGSSTGSNTVTMWDVTSRLTNASTYTASASNYYGGSSGIAADNTATGTAQAASIYFSTLTAGSSSTNVSATTPYNVNGIYTDGTTFPQTGGLDNDGNAYSGNLLGSTVTWNGTTFNIGPANALDAWSNTTITLPSGNFSTLTILAAAVNVTSSGITETFSVNYTDGTSTTLSQNFSDWFNPLGFNGESIAKTMAYRDTYNGGQDNRIFDVYGYSFAINPKKTVSSLTLPANRNVVFLAAALSINCGGADYCAVKLTQSGLQ